MGEDMRIVRYKGGLGNQMFQYAFMRSLDSGIHKAGASLGFYKDFPMSRHNTILQSGIRQICE